MAEKKKIFVIILLFAVFWWWKVAISTILWVVWIKRQRCGVRCRRLLFFEVFGNVTGEALCQSRYSSEGWNPATFIQYKQCSIEVNCYDTGFQPLCGFAASRFARPAFSCPAPFGLVREWLSRYCWSSKWIWRYRMLGVDDATRYVSLPIFRG